MRATTGPALALLGILSSTAVVSLAMPSVLPHRAAAGEERGYGGAGAGR